MAIVEFKQHFEVEAKQFFLRTNITRLFFVHLIIFKRDQKTQTFYIVRHYNEIS